MGKEWIRLKETGQLYLEKILVSFDIPILFVCVNYEKRRYLCLNIDEETGKSVIVATDNKRMIAMLKNQVTMESVFRNSSEQKVIIAEYDFDSGEVISYSKDAKTVSADILPKKNEYFELTNKEIQDYITFLEKQTIRVQNESFSEGMSFFIPRSANVSNYTIENLIAQTCARTIIAETKKKCSYDVKRENKMIA